MRISIILLVGLTISCQSNPRVKSNILNNNHSDNIKLDDYWYQGKAEITTYTLSQNRYKETHPGKAIQIFVTEDFLTDVQVKNDHYKNENSTPILKNNRINRFTTGLYDYNIMTSVFTPTKRSEWPVSLKVTMSSQDWCGQSYHQMNFRNEKFVSHLHSYFESEADHMDTIHSTYLEDEIFNIIRMGPDHLPTGSFDIIPSLQILRLMHLPAEHAKVNASLKEYDGTEWNEKEVMAYSIEFIGLERVLNIYFEKDVPYKILGWDDAYPSAFDKKTRTTTARKLDEQYVAYWEMNDAINAERRKSMGLK